MRLTGVRVKNFRTAGPREQQLDLSDTLTIIGPNNSGKTNLLQAIQMLFTGHENIYNYTVAEDSPHGKGARTSIVGYFDGDDEGVDSDFYRDLDRLYAMYNLQRSGSTVALYLTFSGSGNPAYTFFPNQKRPGDSGNQATISRVQKQTVVGLLGEFACHFIPSEKSMKELVDEILAPFIRSVVVDVLSPHIAEIQRELDGISSNIDQALTDSGVDGLSASFGFQGGSIESMLSGFDFYLSDPYRTQLSRKGQGTQSLAFMAALHWVTEREFAQDKNSIWLIEEPESFLHPELSHSATRLLEKLGTDATVVMSSHSMAFVPHDPKRVVSTQLDPEGYTEISTFASHEKATVALRKGLGLRFADYFSLGTSTVLTEGQSDSQHLRWFLMISADWTDCEWPELRAATISDRGGASELAGFLRSNYEILRKEQPTVSLFDGDDAGMKAVSGLSSYFNNMSIPFNANREYVYGRAGFAIEGLFPDLWISDLRDDHPNRFTEYQEDSSGVLMRFRLKDSAKSSVANALKGRAESENPTDRKWATHWLSTCRALDSALKHQAELIALL
ncbi:AAA family ATPase [Brachybacterium paraconglomeratum]